MPGQPGTLAPMDATERVRAALQALEMHGKVVTFERSTATAQEAADSVRCELGQIVKTLVFMADGRPTMVLAAGDGQVDTGKLARLVGVGRKRLKLGKPEEVFALTGFEVGGVSPVGMPNTHDVVLDESLKRFERVWAAAGTSTSVFESTPNELADKLKGQWADILRDV
jgi:Cys-tRNA(Pro) deacylase